MDWEQVALLDGAAPCFFVEGPEFCGRAMSYPGHGNPAFHDYVSLQDFITTAQSSLAKEVLAEMPRWWDYSQAKARKRLRNLFTKLGIETEEG